MQAKQEVVHLARKDLHFGRATPAQINRPRRRRPRISTIATWIHACLHCDAPPRYPLRCAPTRRPRCSTTLSYAILICRLVYTSPYMRASVLVSHTASSIPVRRTRARIPSCGDRLEHGEELRLLVGDCQCVLVLRRARAVGRAHRPLIGERPRLVMAGIDHRLDGEDHAGAQL